MQTYLPFYFSAQHYERLKLQQQELTKSLALQDASTHSIDQSIDQSQEKLYALTQAADGQGREARLRIIHRELQDAEAMLLRSLSERKKLETIRTALGFKVPLTLESYTQEQLRLANLKSDIEAAKSTAAPQIFSHKQKENQLQVQMQALSEELLTTQKNKTLLPNRYLELRGLLCEKIGLLLSDCLLPVQNSWL